MTSEPKTGPETDDSSPAGWLNWQPPAGLPEPARQVWLAGLGALARAQAEGGKAVEALVRQGLTLQTQASQAARERIAEVTQAATQPWERLSGIFEDRVARALTSLGLPSAQDWAALRARVQALEAALQDLSRASPNTASNTAPQPAAAKRPARTARRAPSAPAATAKRAATPAPARAGIKPRAASGKTRRAPPSP